MEALLPSFPAIAQPLKNAAQQSVLHAFQQRKHKCLVMGATGAVGRFLVGHLLALNAFEKVTVLTRRPIKYDGPNADRLQIVTIQDFDHPEHQSAVFKDHTHFFCTHGTTRAQAGSADAFRRIDRDMVLNFARVFRDQNQGKPLHMLVVTATNANLNSMFLYPKTKGEIEQGLAEMGFDRLSVFRPGFLKHRHTQRWVEEVAGWMVPAVEWMAPRKMAVECEEVARAMQAVAVGLSMSGSHSDAILQRPPTNTLWQAKSANPASKVAVYDNEDCVHLGAPVE
jgi:oxidoreductase